DGGHGGSVILRADTSVGTLLELRDHPHIRAERGGHGEGKRRHGASARDRIVLVPPGTVVFDGDVLIADLAAEGEEFVAARGGRGGRGNASFATATRRAPAIADKGEPGEARSLRLELRLLADVALVGFPNAGKSTLISRISAARPKIADYPFTTLQPNLGVVGTGGSSFVVADIPGLVPGASEGKGLGLQFLKHIKRAAVLLYLVDLTAIDRDPRDDVDVLRAELERYDAELATRPALVVATKLDAGADRLPDIVQRWPDVIAISSVAGTGLDELLRRTMELVETWRATTPARAGYVRTVIRPSTIEVAREGDGWRVTGAQPERAVQGTDLENDEAVARLQRRLISLGVEDLLAKAGALPGDEVRIGEVTFDFEPEGRVEHDGAP
ncbi:MAG TPA: GTPase ObgE, partial [Actinomycetota bacterium]|nr:GTPase ObgE [Actinomycetota bacterium]